MVSIQEGRECSSIFLSYLVSLTPQNIFIPYYSTDQQRKGGEAASPFVFCPTNMRLYPVKSIGLLDAQWMNQPTLNVPDQLGLGLFAAQPTESGWIFQNLPVSQCYQMNISPKMPNDPSSSSSRQIHIALYYDSNPSLPTQTNTSQNPYGGYQPPLGSNSDPRESSKTGQHLFKITYVQSVVRRSVAMVESVRLRFRLLIRANVMPDGNGWVRTVLCVSTNLVVARQVDPALRLIFIICRESVHVFSM